MFNKVIKYLFWLIVVAFIAYNSVYIKKLSDVKASETKPFNAKVYAADYLYKKLPSSYNKAPDLDFLITQLQANSSNAFSKYAHSQGNGELGYFLISGKGTIQDISESDVVVRSDSGLKIKLATQFIFGNTVRDAAGLISVDEFNNSMDINNVSEEINKLLKTEIIPAFISKVKKGDHVEFKGCLELNQSALKLQDIEIIPVSLMINK